MRSSRGHKRRKATQPSFCGTYQAPMSAKEKTQTKTQGSKSQEKRKELSSSLNTCQGDDTQMLLIHRLSYGPALTRNTEERASVCQSDSIGLTTSTCNPPYDRFPNCLDLLVFIPHCRAPYITNSIVFFRTHLDLLSIPQSGGKNLKTFR